MVINFFCEFSKIPTKRTFVRLLFLKLNDQIWGLKCRGSKSLDFAYRKPFVTFKIEYLSEIKTEFENTLAWLSWLVWRGSNPKKIEVEKPVTDSL